MLEDTNSRRENGNWLTELLIPFADAATKDLPIGRLMRLSLFQASVGMAFVLLNGTLNRVMVLELGQAVWLVSLMVSLPLLFAPFRALIGFQSDQHKSVLGWRRVPYIWVGTMLQYGGLAVMPFALIVLTEPTNAPAWAGTVATMAAFLAIGAGLHTTQTAGLALATDLASEAARPKVVSLMYVTLLFGMIISSLAFSFFLSDFSYYRLIQVIQGAAVVTFVLNMVALWKQETRNKITTDPSRSRPSFRATWEIFINSGRSARLLVAVGLGTAGFTMQDILLEPYGGEILGLSVSATTGLTALLAGGMLIAFGLSSRVLSKGGDPVRLAAYGAVCGVFAFSAVLLAAPMDSPMLFRLGTFFIGFGSGLFSIGTLTAAMNLSDGDQAGLAIGAWGAVQATMTGLAIAFGGGLRDFITHFASSGHLGSVAMHPSTGYGVVYLLEIVILFAALVSIGPLVQGSRGIKSKSKEFRLAEFPG